MIVWALFSPGGGGATPLSHVPPAGVLRGGAARPDLERRRVIRHNPRVARESAELAETTLALSRDQAEAAVIAERERISVELHDIIAHSVSAMVVQAGSARPLLRSDPEQARESLSAIERTGRDTLTDLRSLLGMLRRQEAQ